MNCLYQFYETNIFPGMSYVKAGIEGTKEVFCMGVADQETDIKVDENTLFHACSVSKWITSLITLKLVEKGLLDLDRDINTYLTKWKLSYSKPYDTKVSLRHLLSHTGGIVDGEDGFYGYRRKNNFITLLEILEGSTFYNNQPTTVLQEPGTLFEYSDAGYCVIQQILEDVTGVSFDMIAQNTLFAPLGLQNTFFASAEQMVRFEETHILATGYDGNGTRLEDAHVICPDLAAAGLWTTPSDLGKIAVDFMKSLSGVGTLLSESSARQIIQPAFGVEWTGLGILRYGDQTLVSKGWGEDAQCMLKIHLDKKYVKIIMGNRNPERSQEEIGMDSLLD